MKHDMFTWLIRCVIVGGFTMGGYIGERVLTKQDLFLDKLDGAVSAIQVMQSAMKLRSAARDQEIGIIKGQVADHEGRIRGLEAKR